MVNIKCINFPGDRFDWTYRFFFSSSFFFFFFFFCRPMGRMQRHCAMIGGQARLWLRPGDMNIGYGGNWTVYWNGKEAGQEVGHRRKNMDEKSDAMSTGKDQNGLDLANFNFGAFQVRKKFFFFPFFFVLSHNILKKRIGKQMLVVNCNLNLSTTANSESYCLQHKFLNLLSSTLLQTTKNVRIIVFQKKISVFFFSHFCITTVIFFLSIQKF